MTILTPKEEKKMEEKMSNDIIGSFTKTEKLAHPDEDVLTSIVGEFGKFQLLNLFLMGLSTIMVGSNNFVTKFLAHEVDYWCSKPDVLINVTKAEWLNLSAPLDENGDFDKCRIFNISFSENMIRPDEETPTVDCESWQFSEELFKNTAMQRWSLVCGKMPNFISIAQSLYFVGTFASALLAGMLSDWFGRKRAFLICLLPSITFWFISYFIDNIYVWLILRFCIGGTVMACAVASSVYGAECTSGKWRSFAERWFSDVFFQIGRASLSLLVYAIPDMKTVELAMALSMAPLLLYHFVLPESPRWLISKGHMEEAKAVLTRGLIMNNLEKLDHLENKEPPKLGYVTDLLKFPAMRRNLLCMCFCWFAIALGCIGLSYNTPTFDWNVYLVFCIPALLVIPITLVMPYFENKVGRKSLLTFSMFFTGFILLCSLAVPKGVFAYNWPVLVFAWIANITLNLAWSGAKVFTKDLFPTTHRTIAFGAVFSCGRLGSLLAPYVMMLDFYDPILALLFYSFWVILAGLASIWIWPETKSTKFPDSLEECEKMASTKNSWLCCFG